MPPHPPDAKCSSGNSKMGLLTCEGVVLHEPPTEAWPVARWDSHGAAVIVNHNAHAAGHPVGQTQMQQRHMRKLQA